MDTGNLKNNYTFYVRHRNSEVAWFISGRLLCVAFRIF